jgi:pimeloyl-ACP methyl ester carboxylesterase
VGRRLIIAALLILCVGATGSADTTSDYGISQFIKWKTSSREAHGGQTVEVNGVKIYYETYGSGPAVLVLHPGTAFLETMHYQITALAPHYFVIAPDSRGHGRSTDAPGPLHYHDMAEDMIGLMDHLHISKADVVGWNDGGVVGLDLAIHHPDRIGRMVLMGTNFDVNGLSNPVAPPADDPSLAPRKDFYRRLSSTPDGWAAFYSKNVTMWHNEPHYTPAELGRIRSPVLVIAGEHDDIRRDHIDTLVHAIPGAKEIIVTGADNMAPMTNPEVVNADIVKFLGEDSTTR